MLLEGKVYLECIQLVTQCCLRQSDWFAFNTTIELIMGSFNKAPRTNERMNVTFTCQYIFNKRRMRSTSIRQHSKASMSLRERDKFGRITWEKLSESVRFAHIARVTRPQDA